MTEKPAVRLSTSSFKDIPYHQMSLEEVVSKLKDGEKKRHEESDPNQRIVDRFVRSAPQGLITSLRSVADKLGITRRVLTCCLTPQVVSWYGLELGLDDVLGSYGELYELVRQKPALYPIKKQMESRARFFFDRPEPVNTSVGTIGWATAKLSSYGSCLGASWDGLLLSGLAWSITQLEHREWDQESIETIFLPEVKSVKLQVEDVKDDLACFAGKYARWTNNVSTK